MFKFNIEIKREPDVELLRKEGHAVTISRDMYDDDNVRYMLDGKYCNEERIVSLIEEYTVPVCKGIF